MIATRVLPTPTRGILAAAVQRRSTEAMAELSNNSSSAVTLRVSLNGSGRVGASGSSSVVLSRALSSSSRVSVRFPHRAHRAPFVLPMTPARDNSTIAASTIAATRTATVASRALSASASTPEDGDDDVRSSSGGGDGGDVFAIAKDGTERFLVAARDLRPGEVVFEQARGVVSGEVTRHSIQVGPAQHLLVDGDLVLMNHSCEPSCQLEVLMSSAAGKDEAFVRVAVRENMILEGEMLTLDYNAMEIDMSCAFDCACGAPKCKGRISGFANLPLPSRQEYLEGRWSNAGAGVGGAAGVTNGPPPLTWVVQNWVQENNAQR